MCQDNDSIGEIIADVLEEANSFRDNRLEEIAESLALIAKHLERIARSID